jgi:uroporphyrinogen decarboxylase
MVAGAAARRARPGSLTPRERVRLTLNHQEPDRVPIDLDGWACYFTEGAYRRLTAHFGRDEQPSVNEWFLVHPASEETLRALRVDFRRIDPGPPDGFRPRSFPDGSWSDEWGIRKRPIGHPCASLGCEAFYAEMTHFPLADATIDDLERYPWPDPADPGRYRGLAGKARHLHAATDFALVASAISMGPFEQAQWLRGPERFLMDLLLDREFALRLLDKIVDFQLRVLDRFLQAVGPYVLMVETSDDLGMQSGPLISPQLYREVIQPCHRRINRLIRERTEARVFLHCCGSIAALVEDLIDAGFEVINPVQPRACDMDRAALKSRHGQRIVFHGGVDAQWVLPYGKPEDVRREVSECMATLGRGGGYILAPAHNLQDDVPPENVLAMIEAATSLAPLS